MSTNAWEFACQWYRDGETDDYLRRQKRGLLQEHERIPEDIYSQEFASWLTEQYRLAMCKGIQIGRDDQRRGT